MQNTTFDLSDEVHHDTLFYAKIVLGTEKVDYHTLFSLMNSINSLKIVDLVEFNNQVVNAIEKFQGKMDKTGEKFNTENGIQKLYDLNQKRTKNKNKKISPLLKEIRNHISKVTYQNEILKKYVEEKDKRDELNVFRVGIDFLKGVYAKHDLKDEKGLLLITQMLNKVLGHHALPKIDLDEKKKE